METPALQTTKTSQEAITALAHLLGRQAARELVEAEQTDPINQFNKDKGARDD